MAAHHKFIEWGTRYVPAEALAILSALIGGMSTHTLFHNPYITALGATWGENIGYYGYIFYKDMHTRRRRSKRTHLADVLYVIRGMLLEFSAGEYIDSFFVRPTAMYVFPQVTGNVFWGIFLGKLAADVTFYIPTILSYELKKKLAWH